MHKLLAAVAVALLLTLLLPIFYSADSPDPTAGNLIACDPAGRNIFAFFNTGSRMLNKSEDSGLTWTTADVGTGLNGNSLVSLIISPDYSQNGTLWAATASLVYQSTDGGVNFTSLPPLPGSGSLTSLAVNSTGAILAGTSTGTGLGGVFLFEGAAWSDLQIGERDVFAVAFSPDYDSDNLIMALTDNNTTIQLETLIVDQLWNETFSYGILFSGQVFSADIAFPVQYYDAWKTNYVFVAVNGQKSGVEGAGPDLYRVRFSDGVNVTKLNLNEAQADCNVRSVTVADHEASYIAAGLADSNMVKNSSGYEEMVGWTNATIPPEGSADVELEYVFDNATSEYRLYAITTGTGYGVFYSTDFGFTFKPLLQPEIEDLAVTAATENTVWLAWTAPHDVNWACYYDLRCLAGAPLTEANWDSALPLEIAVWPYQPGASETCIAKGLQPRTTYYFAIKTNRDGVWSAISNSPAGTTLPVFDSDAPSTVSDLAVFGSTTSSLTLKWTAPGDPFYGEGESENGVLPVDGASNLPLNVYFQWPNMESQYYAFQLSDSFTFDNLIDNQTGLTDTAWIENITLQPATTYSWRVGRYYEGEGYGGWETWAFTTLTAHTAYDIRYSSQFINSDNWDSAAQCSGEPLPAAAGTAQTFTVRGLSANRTYYFALATGDQIVNWSEISNCASGKTDAISHDTDSVAPAPITDLKVIETSSHTATLQWTAPGDDNNRGTARLYEMRYLEDNTLSAGTWSTAREVTGETRPQPAGSVEKLTVQGLSPEITYYFAIKTQDEAGNLSLISNIASGTTPDTTPPADITDLAASAGSANTVTLTWTATGDDGLAGTASQYDIRYARLVWDQAYDNWQKVLNEPLPKTAGSKETFTISGLDAGTTYYFTIRVADEVPNWSGRSENAAAKTAAEPTPTHKTTPTVKPTVTPHSADGGVPLPDRDPLETPEYKPVGPIFSVTNLNVSKEKVKLSETVKVTATVANTGDLAGDCLAVFLVNEGIEKETNMADLKPGSESTVEFEFNKSEAGNYILRVGEKTAAVQVVKPIRPWVWILIALLILVIILVILRQVLHWGFKGEKKSS